ncbi:hypothetical protein F5Y06DRAFT_287351 [Hypoxylon sp. FL0890]|nr:hypothetical protein F5Y06DRAFT_287351 [Hypoxylon sp. FL0890]
MTGLFLGRPLRASRFACHILTLRRCISTEYTSRSRTEPPHVPIDKYSYGGVEEIQPGEHVTSFSREHRILFPGPHTLRGLKGFKLKENPCKLGITASQSHCFDVPSLKYLDKNEHPFAKSILQMYLEKKKEPLWYTVNSHQVASPFPCKEGARRVKHAFRDALAAYGYDREGRRITMDGSSVIMDLYGTLRINVGDPKAACNTKFADLLEQAKKLVSRLELALARNEYGRHINTMDGPQRPNNGPQQSNNRPQRRDQLGIHRLEVRPVCDLVRRLDGSAQYKHINSFGSDMQFVHKLFMRIYSETS